MSEKTPFSYSSDEDKAAKPSKVQQHTDNPFASITREQALGGTAAQQTAPQQQAAQPKTAFDQTASNAPRATRTAFDSAADTAKSAPAQAKSEAKFEESGEDFKQSHKAKSGDKKSKPAAETKAQKGKKTAKSGGKKSNVGKTVGIVAAALLAVAIVCTALYYFGVVDFFPQKAYTYEAADTETFLKYLSHPSLKAGDTINTTGDIVVDVDEEFGGFASLPLVNLSGVEFKNGSVLFLGGEGQSSASLDGITFTDCEVYLDAESTNVTFSAVEDDTYINCKTLNGTAHLVDYDFPMVGAKMTVAVKLTNTGSALTNAEVTFSSPSYIFPEGETFSVDSIPANGSVEVNVPVIAVEGGRTRILAHDSTGAVSGDSGFVDIIGTGYYSGDTHTHSSESYKTKRTSTVEENVEAGYENGMSFIFSVENVYSQDEEDKANEEVWAQEEAVRKKLAAAQAAAEEAAAEEEEESADDTTDTTSADATAAGGDNSVQLSSTSDKRSLPVLLANLIDDEGDMTVSSDDEDDAVEIRIEGQDPKYGTKFAEQLTQSDVDSIVGGSGRFIQIAGAETGQNSQHLLYVNSDIWPRSDYGRTIYKFGLWTYQNAIDYITDDGGIVILPHFFDRDSSSALSTIKGIYGETAIEIMSGGRGSDSVETTLEINSWDMINAYGMNKLFAVMASNNTSASEVGTRYISGLMGRLTEENIYTMLESGNYIATNGPTVRFELGGAQMGETTFVPASAMAEDGSSTVTTQAKIYACDDSPLTSVRLIRCKITNIIDTPQTEDVINIDLTGQNVYEYSDVIDVEVSADEFYRLEVRSEEDDLGDDVGVGLSNPVYIYDSGSYSESVVSARGFGYKLGGEAVKTANNRWIVKTHNFIPSLFSVDTDAAYTDIVSHKLGSSKFADYVSVYMLALDAKTSTCEKVYIVND